MNLGASGLDEALAADPLPDRLLCIVSFQGITAGIAFPFRELAAQVLPLLVHRKALGFQFPQKVLKVLRFLGQSCVNSPPKLLLMGGLLPVSQPGSIVTTAGFGIFHDG